jgi:hypothetical protein
VKRENMYLLQECERLQGIEEEEEEEEEEAEDSTHNIRQVRKVKVKKKKKIQQVTGPVQCSVTSFFFIYNLNQRSEFTFYKLML